MRQRSIFLGKKRALKNLLFWFATLGTFAIVSGQNCGRQDWNNSTGTSIISGNNGGLYGGLTAENGGGYMGEEAGGFSGSDPNSIQILDSYILARHGGLCSAGNASPSLFASVSSIIQGIISPYGDTKYVRPSLCSSATAYVPGNLSVVDFDHRTGIAADQIYFFYLQAPLVESAYKFPVAHCRAITSTPIVEFGGTHSLDLGITASLYLLNGQLRAEVARGIMVGDMPTKYFVPPFSVSQEISQTESKFTQSGFELRVANNGLRVTTGRLVTNVDRQPITTNMNCWVENP